MMVSFFKHIAVRIWLTVLLGGVACLGVLPSFQARIGLEWALLPVAFIIVTVFVLIGWVLNRWGLSTVERLIHDAGVFERDGMVSEAENRFRRALSVFDSFLISPLIKKQKSGALTARVARFYLARARRSYESELFLVSYLQSNPEDEEVAENWIQQIESRGGLREQHQELAYLIGSAQPKNRTIQSALARYYLMLERTDFPALQTYRRALTADLPVPVEFVKNLANLFLREKRADEWALEIYLQAIGESHPQPQILRGIAACVRWISLTERNKPLLQRAYTYLHGLDLAEIKKMSAGFKPPVPPSDRRVFQRPTQKKESFLRTTGAVLQTFYEDLTALPLWIFRQVRSAIHWAMQSRKSRRVLTGVLLAGLTAAVIVLVINTVGHLVKSETPVAQKIEKAPEAITDPFTLQVAAYLKPTYAKRYVVKLKKQGLDAYWREAISANKKWYQVRVSHFPDKKSARDVGESLKAKGIIDDYYVANFIVPK
ncbi:MAG: SPOR domain-containing protein [Desulfobacterales bacterium]